MNDTTATEKDYVPAAEALRMLGLRKQSLYAYVSRGWIRSIAQPGRKERLYAREDIDKVRARSQARSGHGAVAASAMYWGEPIIPTSITEITPQGPRYRGRLAIDLARAGSSFESVAELLWTGLWHDEPLRWKIAAIPAEVRRLASSIGPLRPDDQLLESFALLTLKLGMARGSIAERVRGGHTLDAARQLIQTLVGCFGCISSRRRYTPMREGDGIAGALQRALAIEPDAHTRDALEAILILLADHELAPGAFAARIAASSGASLHSCIAAAICTNTGVHVARQYDRVEDFLAGASTQKELLRRAQDALARTGTVPGFAHPLYPKGDPRSEYLLDLSRRLAQGSKRFEAIHAFAAAMRERHDMHVRHEMAIIALGAAIGIPDRCAGALFTLARIAGWVAHVQEQRLMPTMLRPRAKFVDHDVAIR